MGWFKSWLDLAGLAQDYVGYRDLVRFVELAGLAWAGDLVGLENWLGCVVLAQRTVCVGGYVLLDIWIFWTFGWVGDLVGLVWSFGWTWLKQAGDLVAFGDLFRLEIWLGWVGHLVELNFWLGLIIGCFGDLVGLDWD